MAASKPVMAQAEQNALPELNPEHSAPRQTVIGYGPAFDTPHNPTGEEEDEEIDHLKDKKQGGAVRTGQQSANYQVGGVDQGDENSQEDAHPPTGAEFRGAVEHTTEGRWAKGLLGINHRVADLLASGYDIDLTFVPGICQQGAGPCSACFG
jgi:hypothetical protein